MEKSNRKNKSPAKKQQAINRKQIQSTLNQLYRLQSQIHDLNVAQNPHSSPPVKKQIKQLAYLYENMTKSKQKNNLNVSLEDIQCAFHLMNPNHNQISQKQLKKLMKEIYNNQIDTSLINQSQNQPITPLQLYNFINYNDYDQFDPMLQAYQLLTDSNGNFNFDKYNQLNSKFGLPKIKNQKTLLAALQCQKIGIEEFRKIAMMNNINIPYH